MGVAGSSARSGLVENQCFHKAGTQKTCKAMDHTLIGYLESVFNFSRICQVLDAADNKVLTAALVSARAVAAAGERPGVLETLLAAALGMTRQKIMNVNRNRQVPKR